VALRTINRSSRAFTYADLEAIPEDEHRYELSYGSLVVTPSPDTRHQAIMVNTAAFLHQRKPPSARVLAAAGS